MAPSFIPPKFWGVVSPFGVLKILFGFPHRTAMDLSHDISDDDMNLVGRTSYKDLSVLLRLSCHFRRVLARNVIWLIRMNW
jgi:hypothetical protein